MTLDKSGMKDLESNLEKILQPDHCSTTGSAGSANSTQTSHQPLHNFSSDDPTLVGITPMEVSGEGVQTKAEHNGGIIHNAVSTTESIINQVQCI